MSGPCAPAYGNEDSYWTGPAVHVGTAMFCSAKDTLPATPGVAAVTVYDPAVALAVAEADAMPSGPVTGLTGEMVALAPAGAVKVTVAPWNGLPIWFRTLTRSGCGKAVPAFVACGVPSTTSIDVAANGMLVSE